MIRTNQFISHMVAFCLLSASISQPRVAANTSERVAAKTTFERLHSEGRQDLADEEKGLRFRLSEGAEQPEPKPPQNLAPSVPLSDTETESILSRLPSMPIEIEDEKDFAVRDRSLPPPLAERVTTVSFPQPENTSTREVTDSSPLKVLRYAPEGSVPIASQLSVTFSQSMIPLGSQEEIAKFVPIKLSPQPPGKWRWVGTKTLLFDPETRFPMATQYSVTVPASVRSLSGNALAAEKTWSFVTPSPTVKTTYPTGEDPQSRDTLMFIGFDQPIEPAAVLKNIKVWSGSGTIKTRLATHEEITANDEVHKLSEAFANRFLAFRAVDSLTGQTAMALPAGRIYVRITPGITSTEGPLSTTRPQGYSFLTHEALRVSNHSCEHGKRCRPSDSFEIEFNNPIDPSAFDQSQVKVDPPMTDLEVSLYGNAVSVNGVKRPRTIYRVTLDPSIKDKFGQRLGRSSPLTFNVGSPPPGLFATTEKDFIVLDPLAPASFSVYSMNYPSLKTSLYSVTPEDYPKWQQYQNQTRWDRSRKPKPMSLGRLVFSRTDKVNSTPDTISETEIDLTPALTNGHGQMILVVEAVDSKEADQVEFWLQRTNIGLDALVDNTSLVGWATSLKDGTPLSGVEMKLLASNNPVKSGGDGTARMDLPAARTALPDLLVARKGPDVAILPRQTDAWEENVSTWFRQPQTDSLRWYVFDDRKLYQPGEEVHVKGWIRLVGGAQRGDVDAPADAATATDVIYQVKDSRGNEITKAAARLGPLGGFDLVLKLPATMNLGSATLELLTNSNLTGAGFTHRFEVQEFRRPEYEVNAKIESEGPHFVGGGADVSVTAAYFAGGGLPNADVTWKVTAQPGSFTPPNRQEWTFGKWKPWWIAYTYDPALVKQTRTQELTGKTDATGKHKLHLDFDSVDPPQPSSVTAEVSVMDVNRQEWTAKSTMLVHPASLYVGIRSEKTFVQPGEPLLVQSIVTDLDGKAVTGREIRMRAVLLDWKQVKGEWEQVETNPSDCSIRSVADAAVCTFQTSKGGQYRVTASILDDRERRNESELTLWVAGGRQPESQEVEEERVDLIPNRKEYKAGDIADILVQAPFYPAKGLLTLSRSGILRSERFLMSGPSHILRVPIEEGWTPNLHVHVALVATVDRGGTTQGTSMASTVSQTPGQRPAFASGKLELSIPPHERQLQIVATPRDKTIEPGGETSIDLEVKDHYGKPINKSELAVVVVDESVLSLTNYRLDDPLAVFYLTRSSDTSDFHLRNNLVLALSATEKEQFIESFWRQGYGGEGPGGGGGGLFSRGRIMSLPSPPPPLLSYSLVTRSGITPEAKPIRLRENFNALAAFVPSVSTDANGRALVKVKLPDNLTRYRVMAVGVAGGKHFGMAESAITVRLPVMVRASAPRFLNFGDAFELPVVVQNQTDSRLTIDVAVKAHNATLLPPGKHGRLAGSAGRRVTVPANDRVEVRFPTATMKAGTARFVIGATSGNLADAAHVSLPVLTPATTEAFTTYGEIDNGAIAQLVKAPENVFPQFGGLEINTSSTQLHELSEAVLYLTSYPYECSEQIASRMLGIVALGDVSAAFNSQALPSSDALREAVALDLKRLEQLQHDNGGYSFWRRDDEAWPYLSIHVAHALARANNKGFVVPNQMWKKSLEHLRQIEKHIPKHYSKESREALIAYAIYVRFLMDDKDPARARRLIQEAGLEKLSLEAVGWLLSVLSGDKNSIAHVNAMRRLFSNRVTETAGAAHFVTSYSDGAQVLLHSKRRTDGVILEALIRDQPESDLIPKIVKGLLAHRQRGRWDNTQENVFILIALERYFNTYEKVTPDFVARVWLGNAYAGDYEFKGRTASSFNSTVPMRYLADQPREQPLTLSKDGMGRLYYRLSLNYAPRELNIKSADYGFTVERAYESVDHPEDVSQEPDGTWRVKPGARVRVRVTMVSPERRYHVALVDPLPAGFEALNPALATTASIPEDNKEEESRRQFNSGGRWRWRGIWFDHQNLRDDRAEAFTPLLWEGVYTYAYVARATTPGLFVVPPPKAEEMYSPETFGRGKTDHVRID